MKVLKVGGGKGGTGKSIVSIAGLAWAISKDMKVAVFDGDHENTDVLKPAEKRGNVTAYAVDLRSVDGWLTVANGMENGDADLFVINEPAGATDTNIQHEHLLRAVMNARGATGTLAFVLNRQRDSLEILKRLLDGLSNAYATDDGARWRVAAVRNLYWGAEEKFARFNGSAQAKRVDVIVNFPELHDLIADKIIDFRLLTDDCEARKSDGAPVFSIAERSMLAKFNRECAPIFDALFGAP